MQDKDNTFLGKSIDNILNVDGDNDDLLFDTSTTLQAHDPASKTSKLKAGSDIDEAVRLIINDPNRGLNSAYNPASHAISQNSKKGFKTINELTKEQGLVVYIGNKRVVLSTKDNLAKMRSYLGINTDNMLIFLMVALCELNSFKDWQKHHDTSRLKLNVSIDYDTYAQMTGVDVSTQSKRKNASIKFKDQLKQLKHIDIDISDYNKGDHASYSVINSFEVKASQNIITAELDRHFASYVMDQPRTIVDPKLLQIPAHNNKYVYNTGKVLNERYYMHNNRKQKTYDRIKIGSLLALAGYPSYEEIQTKHSRKWRKAVVKPLERALEELKKAPHDLLAWTGYGLSKGKIVKNKEFENNGDASKYKIIYKDKDPKDYNQMDIYKDYNTFINLYLYYKFNDDYSID